MAAADDTAQELIDDFFMRSHDFNGIPLHELADSTEFPPNELREALIRLVQRGSVSLQRGENPHIIRLRHLPTAEQLELLANELPGNVCVYPSETQLAAIRTSKEFEDRPYTLMLSLAAPQLTLAFFEMDVLEAYVNDPRYRFHMNDYDGRIGIMDEVYEQGTMPERDQVFIQSFGIGYTAHERRRVVCVYLRYLHDLTPDLQRRWKNKEVDEECYPFSKYYANTALGDWDFCMSMFTALLQEQKLINELTMAILARGCSERTISTNAQGSSCTS